MAMKSTKQNMKTTEVTRKDAWKQLGRFVNNNEIPLFIFVNTFFKGKKERKINVKKITT